MTDEPASAGWGTLRAFVREARTAPPPPQTDCPNDGTPLVNGHCPFDGYLAPGASAPRRPSGDWGGLRAALTATPTRRDPDDDPPGWG